ncbi:hypothetical protein IWQ62_001495 [Dispira parvispora]|uniref:Sepiapterin reductase n=1 Tax=Dispira parvispora TaxID=1520584 RepID=A0A9W8E903_9FUNG|nr:hypothetical protein IWQ62_001495 [Dispira parvispora]
MTPRMNITPVHTCIVVGASSGFGQIIAQAYVTEFFQTRPDHALFLVLVGRQADALAVTATQCHSRVPVSPTTPGGQLAVECVSGLHLDDLDNLDPHLDRLFAVAKHAIDFFPRDSNSAVPLQLDSCTMINNAGTLGDISLKVAQYEWKAMRDFLDINLVSYTACCTRFLRHITRERYPTQRTLVNISSLLAVQTFPYWGFYATAKAARDSLTKVIAQEEDAAYTKTLNYAPGPLDTSMQKIIRETMGDAQQRELYTDMHQQGNLVPMEQSARKLAQLVLSKQFESGSHIDYFDE